MLRSFGWRLTWNRVPTRPPSLPPKISRTDQKPQPVSQRSASPERQAKWKAVPTLDCTKGLRKRRAISCVAFPPVEGPGCEDIWVKAR